VVLLGVRRTVGVIVKRVCAQQAQQAWITTMSPCLHRVCLLKEVPRPVRL
jgi:hypothetical protein